ncbi:nucleic-acid-binding protein from transposon X-element [Trichonephila clavipes]|nr:nucleic-acid-binding protein from transposon X-element [Trichonephila clavipes]
MSIILDSGMELIGRPIKKCPGVKELKSLGSKDKGISGRLFNIPSAWLTTVKSSSKVKVTYCPFQSCFELFTFNAHHSKCFHSLARTHPNAVNKLTGQYIRILAATTDEHREIIAALKAKGEEFYSVPPLADRPLKAVIKGLPKSTTPEEIKDDLLNQGVPVIKISQLTQRKSKFPLPIYLIEVRKHVDGSTDIYEISKCCFMSVVIDTFKKRPGATQCYNCNFFNHSSVNCFMKPRCLKCSKEHRTGNCPIKERLHTPHCINCDSDGHPANWRSCPAFPKIKNKKGAPAENRNKPLINSHLKYPILTSLTQMRPLTNNRWQHLSIDPRRRRIVILSPNRIKKRGLLPHLTDSFRLWPNLEIFLRTSQASWMQGKLLKTPRVVKNALTSFSVS